MSIFVWWLIYIHWIYTSTHLTAPKLKCFISSVLIIVHNLRFLFAFDFFFFSIYILLDCNVIAQWNICIFSYCVCYENINAWIINVMHAIAHFVKDQGRWFCYVCFSFFLVFDSCCYRNWSIISNVKVNMGHFFFSPHPNSILTRIKLWFSLWIFFFNPSESSLNAHTLEEHCSDFD